MDCISHMKEVDIMELLVKIDLENRLYRLIDESDLIYVNVMLVDSDGYTYEHVITYKRKGITESFRKYWNDIDGINYFPLSENGVFVELHELIMDRDNETTIAGFFEFANDYEESDFISFTEYFEELV